MKAAEIVAREVEAVRAKADREHAANTQAEADRRETRARPFPAASDIDALIAAGTLIDLSSIASRCVSRGRNQTAGFFYPVFATPAFVEAVASAGSSLEAACSVAWHQVEREGGEHRRRFDRALVVVPCRDGSRGPLFALQFAPRSTGVKLAVLHLEAERCPVWVP